MSIAPFPPPSELSIANPVRRDAAGVIRVGQSRVTLEIVISAYDAGSTAEEIALEFDAISLAQVYGAIAYYLQHKRELAPYFAARQQASTAAISDITKRQAVSHIRERLLMRQTNQGKV